MRSSRWNSRSGTCQICWCPWGNKLEGVTPASFGVKVREEMMDNCRDSSGESIGFVVKLPTRKEN